MDLRLKRATARNAVIWVLNAIGVFLLLWAFSVKADTAQAGSDYLFPADAKGGFISFASSTESTGSSARTSATKSSTVSYTAFDGSTHQLVENRGRYVNVLLPESFNEGPFFTADHVEEMVDRLDMLYVLYSELVHDEPGGSGLLNVAFVPQTCGMGCGLIGARGFEVLSVERNYEAIIRELDAGRLEPVLLHEMAHNFDTKAAYLHYLPDHAHAWTDMFEFFAPFRYSRVSSNGESPDDRYNSPVSSVWKDYVIEDSADWNHCVRDGSCGDLGLTANSLWAMLYYRIEALHGIDAILKSFEYLKDYARTNSPPSSIEAKESVRILSLAHGAGVNIACYMDALKWPIQSTVRSKLEKSFGSNNKLCADLDGDGFNAINGDCDDTDRSVNIGATEISGNGVDDDCDDLIDETTLVEVNAGSGADNFGSPVQAKLPFEVEGSSVDTDDRDSFRFSVPASGRTRVTLCASGGFKGWVVAQEASGAFLEAANWYVYRAGPGCTSNTFDFGTSTSAGLVVMPDKSAGEYSLVVTPAVELLPDLSSSVQVSSNPAGGMTLQVNDDNGLLASLGADEIEIWISGVGVQLFRPFADNLTVALNSNAIPGLRDGETYQVRIRPRADGLPLAAFSAGHLFRFDQSTFSLPTIDHRFSGAWYDTAHNGEGFLVEILEDNRAVVFWFTYHGDGTQRWMGGTGTIKGNRIMVTDLVDTHGGRFGANFDPDDVVLNTVGSLSISFLDCSTALFNYSVDDTGAHQSTTRLSQLYGHGCDGGAPPADSGISGSWYDPSHNGEGFIVEQITADKALVYWFTYDETGKQSWMGNVGTVNNGVIEIPELLRPLGGQFGRSFDPQSVIPSEWGELTLDLDCSGGSANYSTQTEAYSSGSQLLTRLTVLAGSECSD